MPTVKNLCPIAWTLRTGQHIEVGETIEVSAEDAAILAGGPYLEVASDALAPADAPVAQPSQPAPSADPAPTQAPIPAPEHPTPDELRAEAERLLAEADSEESK